MGTRYGRLRILPLLLAVLVIGIAATSYAGSQAYLGVMLQPLTLDLKEAMDVDRDLRGVLISEVIDDSPADEYGLEDGDVIIEIDGKEIHTVSTATRTIKSFSPGDEIKIVVMRDGDKKEVLSVTLGEREEKEYDIEEHDFIPGLPGMEHAFIWKSMQQGYLGVRIENISEDLGDYFGVDKGEGVLVLEVVDDSPAEEAGLRAGDVILKVDGKDVSNTDNLVKYIRKYEPGDEVEITYKRQRRTKTLEVELGAAEGPAKLFSEKFDKFKMPGKSRIRMHKEGGGCAMDCLKGKTECHEDPDECPGHVKGGGKHIECYLDVDDDEGGKCIIKRIGLPKIKVIDKDGVKKSIQLHLEGLEDLEDLDIGDLEDIDMDEHIRIIKMDAEEFDEDMEDLEKEMQDLKKEMQKLKEELRKLKE